jgi:hypothetical protein
MHSYEIQFVRDIVAGGDLGSVERLIQALFGELGSKIPTVRNPRRLASLRVWRENLSRAGELSLPPRRDPIPPQVDAHEVDLCAKRVVTSGDLNALETLLQTVAGELSAGSVAERDPERRMWMAQTGEILNHCSLEGQPDSPFDDAFDRDVSRDLANYPQRHRVLQIASLAILLALCLALVLRILPLAPFAPH